MILIRVELHSANTGKVTEIARMKITNTGGLASDDFGDYKVTTFRGRDAETLSRETISREGFVLNFPRKRLHIWNLVAAALKSLRYGKDQ